MGIFQENGEEPPQSFGKYLLEHQKGLEVSDSETACGILSSWKHILGLGCDKTVSAISVIILAAAFYPKAHAKVKEKLDRVIGVGYAGQ